MNNAIVGARLDDLGTILGPFNTSAVGIAQSECISLSVRLRFWL